MDLRNIRLVVICLSTCASFLLGQYSVKLRNGEFPAKNVVSPSQAVRSFADANLEGIDGVTHHGEFSPEHVVSPSRAVQLFADANLEGSDKVTYHNYHLMYGPALAPYIRRPVRLLEIGVQDGKSLKLWQRLFPNHELIAGIGYGGGEAVHDTFKRFITSKHVLYTGSQSDSKFLDLVLKDLGGQKFDVIIDDGSHIPWHQIFTLEYMFDLFLKEGGIYIIEDVETSYWDIPGAALYGYPIVNAGLGKHGNAVEKLKGVVDVINRGFLLDPGQSGCRDAHVRLPPRRRSPKGRYHRGDPIIAAIRCAPVANCSAAAQRGSVARVGAGSGAG